MTLITSLREARDFVAHIYEDDRLKIVALTGAGISTESGIPDFRSPGGIWSNHRPVQYQDVVVSEKARLRDWTQRFEMMTFFGKAQPNAAHFALTALAARGQLHCLITQNVDGLHAASGFPQDRLIEIHGNATYATCLDCGTRAELEAQRSEIDAGRSPVCGKCGGFLKAAVVNFGQQMPEKKLERADQAARNCDLFLVLGSSLVVHPAAQLPVSAVRSRAELVILNREETPLDSIASTVIRTSLAETFAEIGQEQPDIP